MQDADELYRLALAYRQAEGANSPEQMKELGEQLDAAFAEARGDIYRILRESRSYAFEEETLASATGERFAGQLEAFRAAPEIFLHEQRLAALERALSNIRKYVVVADQNDTQVTTIDLEDKQRLGVYDLPGTLPGTQESSEP